MAIFGHYGRQQNNTALPPGPEPVWVDGEMGVYNPDTGQFVPITSPLFDQTCDLIQLRRAQSMGYNNPTYPWAYHHWNYNSGGHVFLSWLGSGYGRGFASDESEEDGFGGASNARSFGGSDAHSGSSRGGIGSTGRGFGGSHG